MTITQFGVSRANLTRSIETTKASHLRPIMTAVRDHGCQFCIVLQNIGRFSPPTARPTILLIGDDLDAALGPNAFHQKSLKRYIRRCRSAVIVSCEPLDDVYFAAATIAIAARRDVLIVETRLEYEEAWRSLIQTVAPDISMLIATVKPQGGLQ